MVSLAGNDKLGAELDALYRRYNDRKYIPYDPLKYVYRFEDPVERELVGLVASALAFGRVSQIFQALERLLEIVGNEPLRYVLTLRERPEEALDRFRYRFVSGRNVYRFFAVAGGIIKTYGSIGSLIRKNYRKGHLLELVDEITQAFRGVHYLVPSSLRQSPCKRLFLYFRWMVRDDNIDVGLWNFIDRRELVIPLDTHVFRTSSELGLTSRRAPSLRTAMEITESLRKYSANDPVKYDWGLSRGAIIANNFAKRHSQNHDNLPLSRVS